MDLKPGANTGPDSFAHWRGWPGQVSKARNTRLNRILAIELAIKLAIELASERPAARFG
jgi:hypothetical protein